MQAVLNKIFNSKPILRKCGQYGEVPADSALLRETVRMAWPSVLESLLIAVVGIIDTVMVSTLGDYAIAAVGLTQQPKMLSLAVFMGLSPAVAAVVARRKGEGDQQSAIRVLKMGLVATAALCVLLTVLVCVWAEPIIRFVGSQPDTHESAVVYFRIITAGMMFNVLTMVINAAQRGAGNTKVSMITSMTSNAVNIVFNYLLIGGNLGFPRLGVMGAAIATVLGTVVAFGMALASVLNSESFVCLRVKTGIFEKKSAGSLVKIGSSGTVEQVILRTGFLLYAKIMASLGTIAFTTHQIAMNIMSLSFSFGDGLAVAAVALVGYSLGEKRPDLAQIYGAFCQRCGVLCSLGLSVIYLLFGRVIVSWFSNTPEVLADGEIIMRMMTVIVLLQISQVIYSGCLRGSGDSRFTALVAFINVGILRPAIAALMIFVLHWGLIGAWAGLIVDQLIRLLMTSLRFKNGKWLKIKL